MQRIFDLLNVARKTCNEYYFKEDWDSSNQVIKEDFGDLFKIISVVQNSVNSWNSTSYFIIKAITQSPFSEIVMKAKKDSGEFGLIMLSHNLTQEFEDEYCNGGLKPIKNWDEEEWLETIKSFITSKGLILTIV